MLTPFHLFEKGWEYIQTAVAIVRRGNGNWRLQWVFEIAHIHWKSKQQQGPGLGERSQITYIIHTSNLRKD